MSPLLASLLHSLWIGALFCGAVVLLSRRVPVGCARLRHALALAGAVGVFAGWGVAWMVEAGCVRETRSVHGGAAEVAEVVSETPLAEVPVVEVARTAPARTEGVAVSAPAGGTEGAKLRLRELSRAATLQTWLELVWALGVALGLARIAAGMRANGARWLASQPVAPIPPEWGEAWRGRLEEIARRLEARLAVVEARGAPFVIGIFEPVIVVPLVGCAGVTVAQARVALAHELAHVARRDWAVETGLRVIEAFLFFNPFVRLLAARVRAEREACCDAWACEHLAMPRVEFAENLLAWAKRLAPSAAGAPDAALALGGERGRGGLAERVRRLLGGGASLPVRAGSWKAVAGVSGVVVAALLCWGLVLRTGAAALRDDERVAVLDALSAPYSPPGIGIKARSSAPSARVVSGKVVDAEGRPVAKAQVHLVTGDVQEGSATTDTDGRFATRGMFSGAVRVRVRAEGHALRVVHAEAEEAELREPIVLGAGHTVALRVFDSEGRALPGAKVRWTYDVSAPDRRDEAWADENGLALAHHVSPDARVSFVVEAAGHAAVGVGAARVEEHGPDNPLQVRLPASNSITLRVVYDDDGSPVPDALVRVGDSTPPWSPANPRPSWSFSGLRGSGEGIVRVEHLRLDHAYRLKVDSARAESVSVAVAPGQSGEIEARLPRLRPLRVRLINFPADFHGERLVLSSGVSDPASDATYSRSQPVAIDNRGAGETVIRSTGTGRFVLGFPDRRLHRFKVDVPSAEVFGGELVIDYAAAPEELRELRRVEVRFMHGRQRLYPAGEYHIHRFDPPNVWNFDAFALEAGQPLFAEWTPGTRLRLARAFAMVGAVVDLRPADEDREIVVDDRLTVLEVPVKPAGLIRARALGAEGEIVREATFLVRTDARAREHRFKVSFESWRQRGEWKVSGPVEFGRQRHHVWAGQGLVFARSEAVRVTQSHPVADVELRLPRRARAELRFVDLAGRPAPHVHAQLQLRFSGPDGDAPPGAFLQLAGDNRGRVVFEVGEDIARWKGLELLVEAWGPELGRTRVKLPVAQLSSPAPIRLPPAVIFAGRVINRADGRGISEVRVRVHGADGAEFTQGMGVVTDAEGRFAIPGVAAGQRLRLSPAWPNHLRLRPLPQRRSEYVAGEEGDVVLEFEPM